MSGPGGHDVRRLSIRVALTATALVAVAYLVVAAAVVAIVTQNLTAQVDARLAQAISEPHEPGTGPGHFEPGGPHPPGGLPVLSWAITPDGTVYPSSPTNPDLPAEYHTASEPVTATIGGVDMRVAGTQTDDFYIIVAQSLDTVSQARSTIILAEVIIAPILLAVVFLGAVAIGRRVAAPVELARRRQLEFTADASHELRTPLSVIEAETTLALGRDREAEWYRGAFGRVDRESKRMHRLVDDLLWLARFDATRGLPDGEPVDLGVLASEAVDRFHSVAEARRLTLALDVPAGPAIVTGPAEWLDRLLGVLLDNACKYSPPSGTVSVTVVRDAGRIRLTVDDSGPGIPAAERELIFDRFHRASDQPGGAGLGLAIGDAIVRATNGRWRIGDSPAGGASMSVTWAPANPGQRSAERSTRPAPTA
ncbi:MAG: sensor histidine kinase [Candidatus Limnocylindrales bacterium]